MIHIVNEKLVDIKLRQLRQTYQWFIQKLVAMGALSEAEQNQEAEFLNPMTNQLANSMKQIIRHKVHSALCNEESVEIFNKAMYEGKIAQYDADLEENVLVDDPSQAQRTHHPEIQPAAIRIQTYKHKQFGQKYKDAVDEIKRKDHQLSVMKKRNSQHGLMTAQLGSVYDVPINVNESQADGSSVSTKAGSSVRFSDMTGGFSQTEGATFKPAFKTFYTNAE